MQVTLLARVLRTLGSGRSLEGICEGLFRRCTDDDGAATYVMML